MSRTSKLGGGGLALAWLVLLVPGAPGRDPDFLRPASKPVPDVLYWQETGRQVPSDEPLTGVAVARDGTVLVGTDAGIRWLRGEGWAADPALGEAVRRLVAAGDHVWAVTAGGLRRRERGGKWTRVGDDREGVTDVAEHRGGMVAAGGSRLYRVLEDRLEPWGTNQAGFAISRVVSHQESLYVLGQGRLAPFAREQFGGLDVYGFQADLGWDWGALPSPRTRDVTSLGHALVVGTDRGLGVLRGMSMASVRGEDGLPYEDVLCLARGFGDDLWIGTSHGAIRQVDGRFQYFAGRRWLPGERVAAVAVDGAGKRVYCATEKGLGILEYRPYTLAKKAEYYEQRVEAWGQKRLGFLHKLEWDAATKEFVREVSDNDGGYTGDYLAAQSYRWAVTRDPAARREATNTFHALRWLEGMTGIPGLPARSVWAKGERGHKAGHGSGGYAAEWHDTADGLFEWKGDTSSDEICSHFYAISLFLELAAEGAEIAQAKTHLVRIADHLVRNGWKLVDRDGNPTRWGRWDPEYFRTDEGRFDRGLQAVQILSFVKTAEALTGDARFTAAYGRLVELGYPEFTLRARSTFPPDSVLHFEDQLEFWGWWNLLRHERDPELRALYRRGYERTYEVVRIERNPWYNFLYAVLTGNVCEADAAVEHLRDWPLDLRVWSYQNSHRADLRTPPGYVSPKGGVRAFSPREHEPMRWDNWTMKMDGGAGGNDVVEPGGWLVAYWMGRYHGFILPPETQLAEALRVHPDEIPAGGARPYEGPGRPSGY